MQNEYIMEDRWSIWIDTGGTFTDCIATSPSGELVRAKVLSSSGLRGRLLGRLGPCRYRFSHKWETDRDIFGGYRLRLLNETGQADCFLSRIDFDAGVLETQTDLPLEEAADFEITAEEEAPILAARLVTGTALDAPLPPLEMRLGSTKGTNALLEKKGAQVSLLITRGFRDLIAIGTQQRPHLFQLDIPEPELLYDQVLEVEERIDASGRVILPLEDAEIARIRQSIRHPVVAIALLHAYRNPVHEMRLRKELAAAGIRFISLSQELSPGIKILPRAQAALVNAYLSPVLHDYLYRIRQKIGRGSSLLVMTSAGGLISAPRFQPKDSLLSGPAGGVVGAARIAAMLGFPRVLTLDMGGTSTDTARYDGRFDYRFTTHVERVEMLSPSLAIETVAAGGGSVCYFDGTKLCVGPESAGAAPGPACYGAGGPLAITDVNLLLGKLDPGAIGIPLSLDKAREALRRLSLEVERQTGVPYADMELLRGFEQIANEKMAEAIRRISIARGFDPAGYALLAFGGAGGLHACRIADLLSMETILLPYDGGLLSAYGIGFARVERLAEYQVLRLLDECRDELPFRLAELANRAFAQLAEEGYSRQQTEISAQLIYLRFKGQDSALEIPFSTAAHLEADFAAVYRHLFGHYPEGRPLEVESLKVIVATRQPEPGQPAGKPPTYEPEPAQFIRTPVGNGEVPLFFWDELREGARISGPAVLLNRTSTAFIEPGWELDISFERNAILHRAHKARTEDAAWKEAVELELFTNRFSAIAEEMGAQLRRTAFSVNIKERLDFSCAILDPQAELLVNAPHIPVHLGSLGICARLVLAKTPLGPGDVIIVNHPKYGGSHLPDVTLLSAVFSDEGALIGYVINRAHHAEIGGKRPGSMPPDARNLAEEGVVFPPIYLSEGGRLQWKTIENMLSAGPWPSRAPAENLADINAALAALRSGEEALQQLVRDYGLAKVHHYMDALKKTAHLALQSALGPMEGRLFQAVECLDDGHRIRLRLQVSGGGIHLDFEGTDGVHPGNLNANISIVYSAVIYVLRLLCRQDIPLNEGLMQGVRIDLPPDTFLHPAFSDDPLSCPAVVGGNTEVSQRLVDTLLKALELAACSQGTMNNFLFGNRRFGYYETICGGTGAGPGFHGRSAVHQHMTNTRITDPEELELRYPVRIHRFAIRSGSGGRGRWRGGDGVVREMEFLEPVEMTLLSQHRRVAPYGQAGGQEGLPGQQFLIRPDGIQLELEGIDSRDLGTGDRVLLLTPGGGGWGEQEEKGGAE